MPNGQLRSQRGAATLVKLDELLRWIVTGFCAVTSENDCADFRCIERLAEDKIVQRAMVEILNPAFAR
jgi:hypothetical protein